MTNRVQMSRDRSQAASSAEPSAMTLPPWRILIVDDDEDVHLSTKFALGEETFEGRGFQFLHAYSAAEAVKWYRLAADQGFAKAQTMLGVMYQLGEGATQDYAEAAKWFRKAAKQRFIFAQYDLGKMYAEGRGVEQDYAQAHMWFSSAGAIDERSAVAAKLTPEQIAAAQKLARDWKPTTP